YTLLEVLDLSGAQAERLWSAFEIAHRALREAGITKSKADLDVNLFERGYTELTLARLVEVMRLGLAIAEKSDVEDVPESDKAFGKARDYICGEHNDLKLGYPVSWRIALGKLVRQQALGIFDQPKVKAIDVN